ncbi:sensor histidine kinase [Leifsonia aquatica]|uniref:sensor histidine kinase n=1 Tax=Leifsonia aquatica TaxID=144185 RepID=UPI0004A7F59B|nr:histidine kinase [Leifsonia aquatica]
MADRTRVLSALAPRRWVLEPAVAVLLFAAWLIAGLPTALSALALLFYCAAVALSRVLPGVALGIVWTAILLELTEPDPLPSAFRVIAAVAVFATVFGIAAHGGAVLRWFAFGSAILFGPAMAFLFTVRGELKFLQFGPVIAGYYTSQGVGLLLMSLLMIVAFLLAWLLGYLVARQRAFEPAAPTPGGTGQRGSVLVWLASSGGAVVTESDPDRPGLVRRLRRGQLTFDIAGAAAFAVFCLLIDSSNVFGFSHDGGRSGIVVLTVFTVAVALRRLSPPVALALAWLAAVIQMTTGNSILASDLGVLLVLYATAAYGDRVVRWVGLVSAGLGALVAALYLSVTSALAQDYFNLLSSAITSIALQFAFLFVVSVTVLGLSWVLGLLMRTWRAARFSRYAQTVAELDRNRAEEVVVVEQERTRIARDMHDVVAHSLAVVIAQADGARYARHTDPDAVDEALTTIAATARSALGDVRVLLAELRQSQPEGPQPGIDDIGETVQHIRAAGLAVSLERFGSFETLGSAQQIAAFRIVQEALTNALRHGDTTQPAAVILAETAPGAGGPGIVITVRNTMKHLSADQLTTGTLPRIGHGLPGMRERASLAGGTLSAAPSDGVFVVSAFLPAGGAA